MPKSIVLLFAAIVTVGVVTAGCTPDPAGTRDSGEECIDDEECIGDLTCVAGICQASGADDDADAGIGGDVGDDGTDAGDEPDATDPVPPECSPGQTRCDSDSVIERCIAPSDGDPYWTTTTCPDDYVCDQGQCVSDNGEPDECCPDGCGDDQICHNCSCTDYDPDECTFQDQPCSEAGQISNDFLCQDFGESGELRCAGLCNPSADDPDTTCPQDDTICIFEDTSQPNGICMSNCSMDDECADDWMTCRYNDAAVDDGYCQPQTDNIELGEPCPSDQPFSCADNGFCVGGFCRQTCRPFHHDGESTDCDDGYCLAFGAESGACLADSSIGDDECTAHFTTCGQDATGCFPEPLTSPQPTEFACYDVCRLQLDDHDCDDDLSCVQYDDNNPVIGRCEAS